MSDRRKATSKAGIKAKADESRSPALRELLAKSPRLAREFAQSQAEYRKRLEQIKNRLRQPGTFAGALNRLESTGVDLRRFLHILAIEIHGRSAIEAPRDQKEKLRALASRLRNLTSEIEQAYQNEATYADLWLVALHAVHDGPVLVELCAKNRASAGQLPGGWILTMRDCADDLTEKARRLGQLAKNETPYIKSQALKTLLADVQSATGNARRYLPLLAEIIVTAYEVCGVQRHAPTPDSLGKILTRHVLPHKQQ